MRTFAVNRRFSVSKCRCWRQCTAGAAAAFQVREINHLQACTMKTQDLAGCLFGLVWTLPARPSASWALSGPRSGDLFGASASTSPSPAPRPPSGRAGRQGRDGGTQWAGVEPRLVEPGAAGTPRPKASSDRAFERVSQPSRTRPSPAIFAPRAHLRAARLAAHAPQPACY